MLSKRRQNRVSKCKYVAVTENGSFGCRDISVQVQRHQCRSLCRFCRTVCKVTTKLVFFFFQQVAVEAVSEKNFLKIVYQVELA